MPSLIVRDVKNGRVKEVELSKRRFTIGKSDFNDLVLPRDGVSREHCVLIQRDDGYELRDLGSRTGTRMAGAPIEADEPLDDGARFEVGGSRSCSAPPASAAPGSTWSPRPTTNPGRWQRRAPPAGRRRRRPTASCRGASGPSATAASSSPAS